MITKKNLRETLRNLGFTAGHSSFNLHNILSKSFPECGVKISVDFDNEKIHYPQGIHADRDTAINFSKKENFVVLECVTNLLQHGYKPEHIVLEPSTPGGREDGNYYGDILVKDNDGRPFMLIECKTTGSDKDEFEKAWKKTLNDGSQLFRYYNSYRQAQFICMYASDLVDGHVKRKYRLIKMTDNEEQISSVSGIRSFSDVTADGGDYREYFDVWKETYKQECITSGIFENKHARPFEISIGAYSVENNLREVDSEEIKKKYNEFAVILRQHNVSNHENAFDKLVNLFLAKVVDEIYNPDDLHFYWKGTAYDDDFSLQDRLQRLYRDGMKKFLGEDVTYIENSEIDKAFRWVINDIDATKNTIKEYFRALKFFSDNDFAFISVHNERLFKQNAVVLQKIVEMIQNIRLRTNEANQNQLLGDLFEGFLNKGVKQSEGQFFTPMPIVRFIVSALPLENIIKNSPEPPYAIDYACGAGHFLTEYAFRIAEFARRYHPEIPLKEYFGRIVGIEKEYRLSKVSKVSSFMYGHDDTRIIYADALDEIEGIDNGQFSVLIANPPYAVSGFLVTLSEKQRRRYSLYNSDLNIDKNNAIETFFIERAAQLLKSGGVAGIILPVSVLTKDGIWSHAREIILKYFDIISLAKFGKDTFGKTNTSTVTIFLRRKERNTPDCEHFKARVEDWFRGLVGPDSVYQDADVLDAYCKHMGYDIEDYNAFLGGFITDTLRKTEMFESYSNAFYGTARNAMKGVAEDARKIRTRYKSVESTKTFRHKPEEEREQIRKDMFHDFVKAIEKQKVYYFMLAYKASCPVLIMTMPSGTFEGKKFLGYQWSNSKGNEGIEYLHVQNQGNDDSENEADDNTMQQIRGINGIVTPLFNPEQLTDSNKINTLIRKNFLGEDFSIPEECAGFVSFGNLVDMLDFKSVAFRKEIKTNVSLKVEVKSKYPIVRLKNYCETINPSKDEIRAIPKDTVVSFIEMSSMGFGRIDSMQDKTIAELSEGGYTYFKENDVLIAKISPSMENGKCGMAVGLTNGLGLGSTEFHVIRGKNKYQAKFILEYLNREYIRKIAASNETGSSGHRRVPENFYSHMPIPDVPDDILKKIYKECDELDKEQVSNNIRINYISDQIFSVISSLEGIKRQIGKVCDINTMSINPAQTPEKEFSYVDIDSIDNGTGIINWNKRIKGSAAPSRARRIAFSESTLISTVRPNLRGFAFVKEAKTDTVFSTGLAILKSKDTSIIQNKMIYYQFMYSDDLMHQMIDAMPQGSYPSINVSDILSFEIVTNIVNQRDIISQLDNLENELGKLRERHRSIVLEKQKILNKYIK